MTIVKGHPNLVNMHSYKFFDVILAKISILITFASTHMVA
jgi:hypothetical protein